VSSVRLRVEKLLDTVNETELRAGELSESVYGSAMWMCIGSSGQGLLKQVYE